MVARHSGVSAAPLGTGSLRRSSDSFAFTRQKSFTPRDLRLRFFRSFHPSPLPPSPLPPLPHATNRSLYRCHDFTLRTRPFPLNPLPPIVRCAMHSSARATIDLRWISRETSSRNAGVRLLLTLVGHKGRRRSAILGGSKLDADDCSN